MECISEQVTYQMHLLIKSSCLSTLIKSVNYFQDIKHTN